MRYSVTFPLISILLIFVTAAVAVTGALYHGAHRAAAVDLLRDRLVLVLDDVQRVAESALGLGLPLDTLPGVERAMRSHIDRDPEILSIELFDETGVVLYATDESLRGDLVAEEWTGVWDLDQDPALVREEVDAHVLGTRVRDTLGQRVGILAIRYSRDPIDRSVEQFAQELYWVCLGTVALFVLIGGALGLMLTVGVRRQLRGLVDAVTFDAGGGGRPTNGQTLSAQVQAARQTMQQAIDEAERVDGAVLPKQSFDTATESGP